MKIIYSFSLVFLFSINRSITQPVIFTLASDRITPIAGFTKYADCIVDMNGDYLDDIVRAGGKGVFIDYQQEDGSFRQKQFHFPVQSLPSWSICAGDIDNNGYNDLLFASSSSVSFIIANSNGTNYTESLRPGLIESQRSTMADINHDGLLDAFVCNESTQSITYRNTGNGIMEPDSNLIHTSHLPGNYAAIWTDYDNDGDVDLYISKCLDGTFPGDPIRTNLLYRNNHDGTFTEIGTQAGIDDNAQSWSTSFEDFDNDGDFDAFVVNHDFANRLFRNNGDGTFTDVILDSGIDPFDLLAFENSTGDFNNDGYMDIFAELTYRFYLGHGDLTFTSQEAPFMPGGIGDLNNDGFLDVMDENKLWLNEGNSNHWLKINTLGLESNRNGIGARIEVYGNWGRQIREVRSGQSYSPMSSLTTHFGLGTSENVDSLIVRWPSGIVTKWVDLKTDTTYLIPEALCLLPPIRLEATGKIMICPADSIVLNAPPDFSHFQWSNGDTTRFIMIDNEGIYFLIVEDSQGCISISDQVEVALIEERLPVITSDTGIRFCEGDTIMLTSSRGRNYNWSTGESLKQSIKVTRSGSYTVAVDALCLDGQLTSEAMNVIVLASPPPVGFDAFLLPGDSILLTALGENIHWYDQPIGGTLLNIGPSFQTGLLETDTTYFIEAHHQFPGEIQSGGKADTTGAGSLPFQDGYLFFETWEPFTLSSVTVYVPEGGPQGVRFIELYSNDTLLASKQFTVQSGANVLDLDFDVFPGSHYLTSPQGNLFRNEGHLNYPYSIGDAGRITGSSNGENYYYYFYDWKIIIPEIECISKRVPVNILVSSSAYTGNNFSIRIYPNPTNDLLNIEFDDTIIPFHVVLIDVFGRKLAYKTSITEENITLNLEAFAAGIYFLQFVKNDKVYTKRIILQ